MQHYLADLTEYGYLKFIGGNKYKSGYQYSNVWQDYLYQQQYVCDTNSAANFRQALEVKSAANKRINLYPTVLSAHSAEITITSQGTSRLEATLYNYNGRCVAKNVFGAAPKVRWVLSELPSGSYVLKVFQGSGSASIRITKLWHRYAAADS